MWDYNYTPGKKESEFNIQSAEIISRIITNKADCILELGCGTGQLSKLLFDKGSIMFASLVDKSESSCLYVKEYFKQNDIKDYEFFKDHIFSLFKKHKSGGRIFFQSYDLTFSSGLIEHFVGHELKELIEIHKDTTQKYIACIVPNATEENIKKAQTESHKKKYGYEKPMTEQELDNLFVDDIFKKIHGETFYKNNKLLIGVYSK